MNSTPENIERLFLTTRRLNRIIAFFESKNDVGDLRYRDENGEFKTPRDTPSGKPLSREQAVNLLKHFHADLFFFGLVNEPERETHHA